MRMKAAVSLSNFRCSTGDYILRVSASGFRMRQEVLRAYQPSVFRSVALRVAGWTTTGERIEKIWAVLTPLGGGDAHEGSGKLVKLSVQTGDYILRVSASGFRMRQEVLRAYQPSVFRSVALRVAVVEASTVSSLTGTVRSYDGNVRDLRVRLMGLYGDELWEAVPDPRAHSVAQMPADVRS